MPVHRSSRYLRQPTLQVEDSGGDVREVYEQRDTTVFEDSRPEGTRNVTVQPGEDFADTARRHLGRHQYWWILADMNPEVFYPLDLQDADLIRVPPLRSLPRFRRRPKGSD